MVDEAPVGRVADGSWQIGVRRTFPFSEDQCWRALLSAAGTTVWLGGAITLAEGADFTLENGTTGHISVYQPGSHVRLRWQPQGWERASLLQIRVIPATRGTTLSFHQERLPDADARTAMKAHWESVIRELALLAAAQ